MAQTKKKQKYYTVWVGRTPGIYTTWEDCKAQTDKYPSARYKGFKTIDEAAKALANPPAKHIPPPHPDTADKFGRPIDGRELTLAEQAYNVGMRDSRTKQRRGDNTNTLHCR